MGGVEAIALLGNWVAFILFLGGPYYSLIFKTWVYGSFSLIFSTANLETEPLILLSPLQKTMQMNAM
jgi:hypothetical protein